MAGAAKISIASLLDYIVNEVFIGTFIRQKLLEIRLRKFVDLFSLYLIFFLTISFYVLNLITKFNKAVNIIFILKINSVIFLASIFTYFNSFF